MIIKAVKFRKDGFYTEPFAFGGMESIISRQRDIPRETAL